MNYQTRFYSTRSKSSDSNHPKKSAIKNKLLVAKLLAILIVIGFVGVFYTLKFTITQAQTSVVNPAVNEPDKLAWELFMQLNHPADKTAGRGIPDKKKKIGDPGEVVWETWKLARTEVFLLGGEKPSPWDAPAPLAPTSPQQRFEPPKKQVLVAMALGLPEPGGGVGPLVDPTELTNETRMNRATFEFIVNNELYNVEGQEAFQITGKKIDFPVDSIEIKGAWKVLGDTGKVSADTLKKYHTAEVGGKVYGLTGLHIITKDIPNWFWATFEHIDNPTPEIEDLDRFGQPTILKGTKWENYRLRGTQIDFVDSKGNPTILGNTQIEGGFQATSSCISCHANATIGDKLNLPERSFVPPFGQIRNGANRLNIFFKFIRIPKDPVNSNDGPIILYGPTGTPDSSLFAKGGTGLPQYTQLDFLWSLRRAHRKSLIP